MRTGIAAVTALAGSLLTPETSASSPIAQHVACLSRH